MKKLIIFITVVSFGFSSLALAKEVKKEDFSLVISGGISLGAYEAGYNWALLKYMAYLKHNSNTNIQMRSIAGASAGAINTLMSSMAWCRSKKELDTSNTIENNLFYHMWGEVDFEDLLIHKKGVQDLDNTTSLFSRLKIASQAQKIIDEMHQPLYDEECSVPFGFAVTKVIPKEVDINGIKIDNKLFQIPIILKVGNDSKAFVMDYKKITRNNILHLSKDGYISDDSMKKAMFASSAFPIAFEQVELDYVYNGQKERAKFLDGGVFDNIPLDLAIRLAQDKSSDYIFMDPSNLRRKFSSIRQTDKEKPETSPINSAIELLMDIFSSSESSVLYNTLAEHFEGDKKKIHLSDRYFPLTGMLLEHFGAFLDRGFREYDYFIGVYDAIVNSANYACKDKSKECFVGSKKYIYDILVKDSQKAKGFLNFLSREEFGYSFEDGNFGVDTDLVKIYESIKNLSVNDMEDFHTFIDNLNKNEYKAKNRYLKHTLEHPDEWYREQLAFIVQRIVDLENKNSTNLTKAISAVAAYTAGSFYRHKSGYTYNPVSAPLDQDKLWVKYLPYELALGKNMLSLGYENYYYFDHNKFYLPKAIELKPSLSFELYDKSDQDNFARLDLNLNFEIKKDFVSVGFGPSAYRDFTNSIDEDIDFGVNAYIDFLNVIRITATRRDDYDGQDWYVYAGINDIPSFIYWMFSD
jgi:predicted acylesterase/phospholipase RssA